MLTALSCRKIPGIAARAWLLIALPLQADTLDSITVFPAEADARQNVVLTLSNGSPGPCGATVTWGDDSPPHVVLLGNTSTMLTHAYTVPGRFTIQASGLQLPDSSRPPCDNSPQQISLQVADTGNTRKVADSAAASLAFDSDPFSNTARQSSPPVLRSVEFTPASVDDEPFTMAEDVLAPQGLLTVFGDGFGMHTGRIGLAGLPGGTVPLIVHEWSERKITASIPAQTGGELGKRYRVELKVDNLDTQQSASGQYLDYERPSDIEVLALDDPAVQVVSCGQGSNLNQCNLTIIPGKGCGKYAIGPAFQASPEPLPTLWGYHENCAGTRKTGRGVDHYHIELDNGWTLYSLLPPDSATGAADSAGSTLRFLAGQPGGDYHIRWTAAPGSSVEYNYSIQIRGPRGTRH